MVTCGAVLFVVLTITCNFLMVTTDHWDNCDCYQIKNCECGNEESIRSKRQGKYLLTRGKSLLESWVTTFLPD